MYCQLNYFKACFKFGFLDSVLPGAISATFGPQREVLVCLGIKSSEHLVHMS